MPVGRETGASATRRTYSAYLRAYSRHLAVTAPSMPIQTPPALKVSRTSLAPAGKAERYVARSAASGASGDGSSWNSLRFAAP